MTLIICSPYDEKEIPLIKTVSKLVIVADKLAYSRRGNHESHEKFYLGKDYLILNSCNSINHSWNKIKKGLQEEIAFNFNETKFNEIIQGHIIDRNGSYNNLIKGWNNSELDYSREDIEYLKEKNLKDESIELIIIHLKENKLIYSKKRFKNFKWQNVYEEGDIFLFDVIGSFQDNLRNRFNRMSLWSKDRLFTINSLISFNNYLGLYFNSVGASYLKLKNTILGFDVFTIHEKNGIEHQFFNKRFSKQLVGGMTNEV